MTFSRCRANPEILEVMQETFERVCNVLQLNGDGEGPVTELVVTKIVELSKAGELEPEKMCIDVLAALGTPPQRMGTEGVVCSADRSNLAAIPNLTHGVAPQMCDKSPAHC
jgi:hypothetical protein